MSSPDVDAILASARASADSAATSAALAGEAPAPTPVTSPAPVPATATPSPASPPVPPAPPVATPASTPVVAMPPELLAALSALPALAAGVQDMSRRVEAMERGGSNPDPREMILADLDRLREEVEGALQGYANTGQPWFDYEAMDDDRIRDLAEQVIGQDLDGDGRIVNLDDAVTLIRRSNGGTGSPASSSLSATDLSEAEIVRHLRLKNEFPPGSSRLTDARRRELAEMADKTMSTGDIVKLCQDYNDGQMPARDFFVNSKQRDEVAKRLGLKRGTWSRLVAAVTTEQ